MTAEIAVMNKSAVALAADSKVTIGSSHRQKTYDTVNKVFTLSKIYPVGIMIYGNAEFMGYPWELIIKQYRHANRTKNIDYIQGWVADFLAFLAGFGDVKEADISENVESMLGSWFEELEMRAQSRASKENIAVPSIDYNAILKQVFISEQKKVETTGVIYGDVEVKAFTDKYATAIDYALRDNFPGVEADLQECIISFSVRCIFHNAYSPQCSGLVIAGFGDKELFPSLVCLQTDGYIGDKIKICEVKSTSISRKMRSSVQAFAQSDMANRFMEGIDDVYGKWLTGAFQNALQQSCLAVLEKYGDPKFKTDGGRAVVVKAAKAQAKSLNEKATEYRARNFSRPITDMVALLPKDEIAAMAETLVSLTSFKRRVSSDAETVGGPVDVAIISKDDGFVWIKRKHYFPQDLNPHFVNLYMRAMVGDRQEGGASDAEAVTDTKARRGPSRPRKTRPSANASDG